MRKTTDFGAHLVNDPDEYEGVCYAVIEISGSYNYL